MTTIPNFGIAEMGPFLLCKNWGLVCYYYSKNPASVCLAKFELGKKHSQIIVINTNNPKIVGLCPKSYFAVSIDSAYN